MTQTPKQKIETIKMDMNVFYKLEESMVHDNFVALIQSIDARLNTLENPNTKAEPFFGWFGEKRF